MLPYALIFAFGGIFLVLARVAPGRALPASSDWYLRAVAINLVQLAIVLLGGISWTVWMQGASLFSLDGAMHPSLQGFCCWTAGTFVFYWWHRARHRSQWLWQGLHQIHHSASRIETFTAFYKHPLEIALNSMLSTAIIFPLLGASLEAAPWYSVFAALGEFYYHANIRTPRWTGWFLQRPEHHSIHHQRDLHDFNYGDITWWDRLFGTFRDAENFTPACGFEEGREQRLWEMIAFRDVNPEKGDGGN